MKTVNQPQHIAILGLGYVGSVTGACLASLGHHVTGVDTSAAKVESIQAGKAPFFEPGLEDLIRAQAAAGRLSATTNIGEALARASVAIICVGTPSERNGNLNLEYIRRVCAEIALHLPGRSQRLVVAVRSTVFPGTCQDVVLPALGHHPNAVVVSNPEFLREGAAVQDFLEPSLLVVGGVDRDAMELVSGLYASLPVTPSLVTLRTAEMIKYACNAFHAVKVAFANEIGSLATQMGIPPLEVMDTLCHDAKLNISRAYLKPGFAFGGSCLPKDLRAICYRANRLDVSLPMLESILPSNEEHLDRALRHAHELPGRLGIFGLAFKENTDDLRESPVVSLIEYLLGKGRELQVFDPHIQMDTIYGANRNFVLSAIPHIERIMKPSLDDLLSSSDQIIITQKPPAPMLKSIQASGLPILDLVYATAP